MAPNIDKSFRMKIYEYVVAGRALPTEDNPEPHVYRMRLFARNIVMAKSRFWYFMSKLNKIKKSKGEILLARKLAEKVSKKVKNFAVWLRYESRTRTINMYKEFRDISRCGVVSQLYSEMTGRHRALSCSLQIMKITEINKSMVKRPHIAQLQSSTLKLAQVRKIPVRPKKLRSTFSAIRPTTCSH